MIFQLKNHRNLKILVSNQYNTLVIMGGRDTNFWVSIFLKLRNHENKISLSEVLSGSPFNLWRRKIVFAKLNLIIRMNLEVGNWFIQTRGCSWITSSFLVHLTKHRAAKHDKLCETWIWGKCCIKSTNVNL